MNPEQKRLNTIIIFIAILVVGGGTLIYVLTKQKPGSSATNPKVSSYVDPTTGQTITTQTGKAVENATTNPKEPVYSGFGKLIDQGLTLDQVTALQRALAQYKPFASNSVVLSIDPNSISTQRPADPDSGDWVYLATLVTKTGEKYKLQISTVDLSSISLIMSNVDGSQQVFDSGTVNSNADSGETAQ